MDYRTCILAWLLSAWLAPLAQADEPAKEARGKNDVTTASTVTPTAAPVVEDSAVLRLFLVEGSVITGKLSVESIAVETEFGTLAIPVSQVLSFTPGLDSHPRQRQQIGRLIQQLGSNDAAERDSAQRSLTDLGPQLRVELERYSNDADTERRTRIKKILEEFADLQDDEDTAASDQPPLIAQDTVETPRFTVVGRIDPNSFQVQTQFGMLAVALADIRLAHREQQQTPEIRKTLAVTGMNLVQWEFKRSGLKVRRGDKVVVTADGSIVMTPWGNNMSSTPEGGANFQWYIPNKIPGGALVARIGTSGEIFKVGAQSTFMAARSGELFFAVAMSPQFANRGYNFPGEYNVKVRVNPK